MTRTHITPVHPGEVLQDELEEIGLTQTVLAKHVRVLPKTLFSGRSKRTQMQGARETDERRRA